jgi:hypothetical protein
VDMEIREPQAPPAEIEAQALEIEVLPLEPVKTTDMQTAP